MDYWSKETGAGIVAISPVRLLEVRMFKDMIGSFFNSNGGSGTGAVSGPAPTSQRPEPCQEEEMIEPRQERAKPVEAPIPEAASFEKIYQTGALKLPQISYGILKVREMADSPHLAGMTAELKRCALMMALEAAGAVVEDLLQDAVLRQRLLNDYEEKQEARLREFEAAKTEQNRGIQAELDRISAQYMARIQANMDEIATQQDKVRAWQKRKQQECQRMSDAAALLVPPGGNNGANTLSAVLEHASSSRR